MIFYLKQCCFLLAFISGLATAGIAIVSSWLQELRWFYPGTPQSTEIAQRGILGLLPPTEAGKSPYDIVVDPSRAVLASRDGLPSDTMHVDKNDTLQMLVSDTINASNVNSDIDTPRKRDNVTHLETKTPKRSVSDVKPYRRRKKKNRKPRKRTGRKIKQSMLKGGRPNTLSDTTHVVKSSTFEIMASDIIDASEAKSDIKTPGKQVNIIYLEARKFNRNVSDNNPITRKKTKNIQLRKLNMRKQKRLKSKKRKQNALKTIADIIRKFESRHKQGKASKISTKRIQRLFLKRTKALWKRKKVSSKKRMSKIKLQKLKRTWKNLKNINRKKKTKKLIKTKRNRKQFKKKVRPSGKGLRKNKVPTFKRNKQNTMNSNTNKKNLRLQTHRKRKEKGENVINKVLRPGAAAVINETSATKIRTATKVDLTTDGDIINSLTTEKKHEFKTDRDSGSVITTNNKLELKSDGVSGTVVISEVKPKLKPQEIKESVLTTTKVVELKHDEVRGAVITTEIKPAIQPKEVKGTIITTAITPDLKLDEVRGTVKNTEIKPDIKADEVLRSIITTTIKPKLKPDDVLGSVMTTTIRPELTEMNPEVKPDELKGKDTTKGTKPELKLDGVNGHVLHTKRNTKVKSGKRNKKRITDVKKKSKNNTTIKIKGGVGSVNTKCYLKCQLNKAIRNKANKKRINRLRKLLKQKLLKRKRIQTKPQTNRVN